MAKKQEPDATETYQAQVGMNTLNQAGQPVRYEAGDRIDYLPPISRKWLVEAGVVKVLTAHKADG